MDSCTHQQLVLIMHKWQLYWMAALERTCPHTKSACAEHDIHAQPGCCQSDSLLGYACRDVAGGSHRFADVKKVLAEAATELGLARKKVTLNSEFGLYTTVDLLPSVWQPVHGQQ